MREQWDALKETVIELRDNKGTLTQQEVCQYLANLMNVLETQMEPERKKGRWNTDKESTEYATCSVCGHCDWDCTESEYFKYCPNCGAQMDERREDG